MTTVCKLHPRYVTDTKGRQTAVIIPIAEYNELLEDLDDLAAAAERADETAIAHDRVVKELKADGYLPG
jgi:PHD/YefM family antitoxin component YafN of YafNO toxin-antitoxin module